MKKKTYIIRTKGFIGEEEVINPNEIKSWYFPNWFNKEHFEHFLDRKLTDEEFNELKIELSRSNICDVISEEVKEFLHLVKDDVFKK